MKRRFRWSLRFNVALLVLAVAIAPLLLVAAWLGMERQAESRMKSNAAFALAEVEAALNAPKLATTTQGPASLPSLPSLTPSSVESIARRHLVHVRLLSAELTPIADFDYDSGGSLSERAGGVMLGLGRAARLSDDLRGPMGSWPEVRQALASGEAQGCDDSLEGSLVVCCAARRVAGPGAARLLHVQDSGARPLPLLYALRFQLGRLTLVILPFALVLAYWVGRLLVGPLEALRDQVLSKVREQRPRADLRAPASNETEELAQAFNTLLQRLEQRRSDNEAFVADLVHEFKNPVAAMRACGERLSSSEVTPERAQQLARLIHESSSRLDALVSQFLELARAEAGMQQEAWEELDLAALTRARVARAEQDPRWLGLRFELNAGARVFLRGVPERLETVLDNLLANAASFAGEKGCVRVTLSRTASHVELGVSDDGPGIAAEDAPHVFERFFTTRRHDKGSGLGLALVRAIVEAHGGQVAVKSEPGQGATFSARFATTRTTL